MFLRSGVKLRQCIGFFVLGLAALGEGQTTTSTFVKVKDTLIPLAPGAVELKGQLGHRIDQCIDNRLKIQKIEPLVHLFRTKEKDPLGYRGEFWGKWAAAAALAHRYRADADLDTRMFEALSELEKTVGPDGYISTYNPVRRLTVWDIWIQKYVLLGLLAQYDATGNETALKLAKGTADSLLSIAGAGKVDIAEFGPAIHRGGVNYCILEPVAQLYEHTGNKAYLDFCQEIVASWSRPAKYSPNGVRLIENALNDVPPSHGEILHAYTTMSNYEGLAELYRAAGNPVHLEAVEKFARSVERYELMVNGTVSNAESWHNCAVTQTADLNKPSETCATATWMKLCYQLLRLTGNPHWADQMELSLYNGLLGSMMPDGEWWCYDAMLKGERVPSRIQGDELSCCVSSGPRGLLITPQWANMLDGNGNPVINLYCQGTAHYDLPGGRKVAITQQTDYPATGTVNMTIASDAPVSFTLALRIPAWSAETTLTVNGQAMPWRAGEYARISRDWSNGDKVELDLDLRGRVVRAPSGASEQAIIRGPIVLALDSRLTTESMNAVWLMSHPKVDTNAVRARNFGPMFPRYDYPPEGVQGYVETRLMKSPDPSIWMTFEVPFVEMPAYYAWNNAKFLKLCDYASAGNRWSPDNMYRIWLPQPMLLSQIYTRDTWKIMHPGAKVRPTVPPYVQEHLAKQGPANGN